MVNRLLPRRALAGGLAGSVLAAATLGSGARAAPPPPSPIALNIIDVAGALALHQRAFQDYRATHGTVVSRIAFVKAPAPELASKIKAQQDAGRSDLDLVLTASDELSAGLAQDLWQPILPIYAAKFPGLYDNYLPAR